MAQLNSLNLALTDHNIVNKVCTEPKVRRVTLKNCFKQTPLPCSITCTSETQSKHWMIKETSCLPQCNLIDAKLQNCLKDKKLRIKDDIKICRCLKNVHRPEILCHYYI